MGRTRKKPLYLIIEAGVLGSIGKDRKLEFDSDPDDNLLDELQCPLFDEMLIALRKSFSLTFPRNPFIDGLQEALTEIRRVCVDALRIIPEVVEELHLKPVPAPSGDDTRSKVYVLKYCMARVEDLQLKVTYEGKTQKLFNMIEHRPADDVIRTLRQVVSDTFEEMYDEDQHEEVLRRIRRRIASHLSAFNDLLVSIEIEPIADLKWLDELESIETASIEGEIQQSTADSNVEGSTPSSGKPSPK